MSPDTRHPGMDHIIAIFNHLLHLPDDLDSITLDSSDKLAGSEVNDLLIIHAILRITVRLMKFCAHTRCQRTLL